MSGLSECELYPANGVCSYKNFNSMFSGSNVYNLDIFGETSEREERKHEEINSTTEFENVEAMV